MADDINPALRAELMAALAVLAPQIRGLHDLTTTSISPDLLSEVNGQIVARERRRDLIQTVIDDLDMTVTARGALEGDGYPNLLPDSLNVPLFAELEGEQSDLEAAISVFVQAQASSIAVSLGTPTEKPADKSKTKS